MKIEILQVFTAAAELRSFSKAGEMLYLSQPTVSRYIGELERFLGGALFVRNAHACELTLLGQQTYVYARRIVNEWKHIEDLADSKRKEEETRIRIGYTFADMMKLVSSAFVSADLSSGKTEVFVRFGDGADIVRMVREEKLDCAVMHLPSITSSEELVIRLICKSGMCMYASNHHHLANRKMLKLEELIHETDVRSPGEAGFFKQIDEAFSRLNLPQTQHEYIKSAADCVPSFISKNCIGFSPSIYPPWPGCVKVPIEDWTTDFSLVFVTKKGSNCDAAERLYKALCATLKKA